MILYRLLTGFDDSAFCKKVSEALNEGWLLHGTPSLTFDPVQNRVVCGQAVMKEVEGEWSEAMKGPDVKFSEK